MEKIDGFIDPRTGRMLCKECQEFDCYLCPFKINWDALDIIVDSEDEENYEGNSD